MLQADEIIPEGTRPTMAPMDMRPGGAVLSASAAPAVADAQAALDIVAERDAAIESTNDALRGIRERLDNEADETERAKLFQMEDELTDKLRELVVLRIRAALDVQQATDALGKLKAITGEMQAGAAQMKTTADALAQAAKIIGLASKVIGIVAALA